MFPVIDIILMTVQAIITVFINPLFWIVLMLVYSQYKRSSLLEEKMLGNQKYSVLDRLSSSIVMGLAGGFVGSLVMVLVGVTLDNAGIIYVWAIAILLMFFNPRYMCFSYAGGIVSLSSLLFGFPEVDVPSLMAIVAILHLVESVLIYFNGHKHSIPVFMKDDRYGIVGGFSLVRFWPIPIIIMTIVSGQMVQGDVVAMPDWWPLLKPSHIVNFGDIENLTYVMLPVVAALGYSDVAITQTPEQKSCQSALRLSAYSIILLIISVLSSHYRPLQWAAALFGPVFHELLIITSRKQEKRDKPVFLPVDRGIRVLDVLPDSVAERMGINRGDIIYRINGQEILDEGSLAEILNYFPTYIWVNVLTLKGEHRTYEYSRYPVGIGSLGILVVPKDEFVQITATEMVSPFKRLIKRLKLKSGK